MRISIKFETLKLTNGQTLQQLYAQLAKPLLDCLILDFFCVQWPNILTSGLCCWIFFTLQHRFSPRRSPNNQKTIWQALILFYAPLYFSLFGNFHKFHLKILNQRSTHKRQNKHPLRRRPSILRGSTQIICIYGRFYHNKIKVRLTWVHWARNNTHKKTKQLELQYSFFHIAMHFDG